MSLKKKWNRKYKKYKKVMKNKLNHSRNPDWRGLTHKEVGLETESPRLFLPTLYYFNEEYTKNYSILQLFSERAADLIKQACRGSADDVLGQKHFIHDDNNLPLGYVQVSELESWEEARQIAKNYLENEGYVNVK